jgi:isopenicillin N synthase-like dioxygenase
MNPEKLALPTVDWLDRKANPPKFFEDLSYALSEFGFMVLTNAPGLGDAFQQRAFREVRAFFDSPMELKKSAHISNSPYFRGYSLPTPAVGFCRLHGSSGHLRHRI